MHPEKGTFKVNTTVESILWGRVSCEPVGSSSEHTRNSVIGSHAVPRSREH